MKANRKQLQHAFSWRINFQLNLTNENMKFTLWDEVAKCFRKGCLEIQYRTLNNAK